MNLIPKVVAECVDERTGTRHFPGEVFPEPSDEQMERLRRANCLQMVPETSVSPGALAAAQASRQAAVDELAAIGREVEAARIHRDDTIAAFANDIATARVEADAEIARIKQEVEAVKLSQTTDPAAAARQQINEDGLFEKTVPELQELAKSEAIDLGDAKRKDEIVAAIRTARTAKGA